MKEDKDLAFRGAIESIIDSAIENPWDEKEVKHFLNELGINYKEEPTLTFAVGIMINDIVNVHNSIYKDKPFKESFNDLLPVLRRRIDELRRAYMK